MSKKFIRVFDPEACKREEYKLRYKELSRIPEFNDISVYALIFVWWYANPTSPLVMSIRDDHKRAEEALLRSKWVPSRAEKEDILRLNFSEQLSTAIARMENVDPGVRAKSYNMIIKILEEYTTIIQRGADGFVNKTVKGTGENAVTVEEIDYPKFVATSAKIAETLPILLRNSEEGFGVVVKGGDEEDDTMGMNFDDTYFSKQNNS